MSLAFFSRLLGSFPRISLSFLTLSLLQACTSIPELKPAAGLGEVLKFLAEKHNICGVAVAVVRAGKVEQTETASACRGLSPIDSNSIFQAASLSKPVFAYVVLKMAQQGKIDLDAPVMRYLPQGYFSRPYPFLSNFDAKTSPVTDPRLSVTTVRMLLNHTSGLPNWSDGPLGFDFTPGSHWQYSGEGYVLLQRAVEAITRTRLDVLMDSYALRPLAMNDSSYVWRSEFEGHFQRGDNGQDNSTLTFSEPIAPATLYTSAKDYGRFIAEVVADKNLIRTTLASAVPVDESLHLSWGLGWGIEQTANDTLIFQWGNNPGYRAFAIASAKTGDGLVILTNSEDGMALAEPITKFVLPGEHPVFRFYMLQEGVAGVLCATLGVCP
ncbi:serine hydrolase domain-containing protein [Methylocystis heyeri]|uniref:serine hydrolase domain-containing protein n=1 Tax=Methylocystis heyeri TaxID=391905 RepID=UPI0013897703|nr:serine hydrolase domain-containing protein [Methylocystis heyeri]